MERKANMKKKKQEHYTYVNWYHPFKLVGYKNDGEVDGKTWGLDLDLRTTFSFCVYEYGYVCTFTVLGFGFELSWLQI